MKRILLFKNPPYFADMHNMHFLPKVYLHILLVLMKNPSLVPFTLWAWNFLGSELPSGYPHCRPAPLGGVQKKCIPSVWKIRQRWRLIELLATLHPQNPRCLKKSLLLATWLDKNNLEYEFKIGWKSGNLAHAWIQINGVPVEKNSQWILDCIELENISKSGTL